MTTTTMADWHKHVPKFTLLKRAQRVCHTTITTASPVPLVYDHIRLLISGVHAHTHAHTQTQMAVETIIIETRKRCCRRQVEDTVRIRTTESLARYKSNRGVGRSCVRWVPRLRKDAPRTVFARPLRGCVLCTPSG